MGGLGKTTLAQSLYNDSQVQKHFDLTAWAWVSDDFDVFRVTKKILESLTSKDSNITNIDNLRVELRNSLREKKFLLVLDDLWNDKYNDWHHLITPLSSGKKGSKIIVTTRQQKVAQVTHTFPICELKPLTDENCWHILARHAFGYEEAPPPRKRLSTTCLPLSLPRYRFHVDKYAEQEKELRERTRSVNVMKIFFNERLIRGLEAEHAEEEWGRGGTLQIHPGTERKEDQTLKVKKKRVKVSV
ncbi:putative disease resistance RPP13 protein 1 [Spatholobus suberectus]|nr:putative disease resistance RPP13 protein 1 [Spatholobus suberectus]